MKKSQLELNPFTIIVAIILIALVLVFGYRGIVKLNNSISQNQADSFVLKLGNELEKRDVIKSGNANSISFSLPEGIEKVCFVDRTKKINPKKNEASNDIKAYTDKNVFFIPGIFPPASINLIDIDRDENPLCINAYGEINLRLGGKGDKVNVQALNADDKEGACVAVLQNAGPDSAIDFVFLGDGYEKKDDFAKEVERYVNDVILSIEPFKSNKDKLNFYRIDEFSGLGCEISSFIKCDNFKIEQLAAACPHDYISVLVERNKIKNFFKPVRSSALGSTAKINTADNPTVLIHELGHAFGGLADEYVDEDYYSASNFDEGAYPNCDVSLCGKWKGIAGAGCFGGCSLGVYFRPTGKSVMKTLSSNEFGPVNEKQIGKRLEAYNK